MPYCVHCGVKLGQGEGRCPLCHTVSVDPAAASPAKAEKAYPTHTPEQILQRSKHYFLLLFAFLLLIPALFCLLIDFLIGGAITWSLYAFTALVLLYVMIAIPIFVNRHKAYFAVISTYVCLMLYLKMTETISHSGNWFGPIVLPCATLFTVLILLIIFLYQRKILGKFTLIGALLIIISLISLATDLLISASYSRLTLLWSHFVAAPCLFLAILIFFINGNRSIREEIRRRVHF